MHVFKVKVSNVWQCATEYLFTINHLMKLLTSDPIMLKCIDASTFYIGHTGGQKIDLDNGKHY